MSKDTDRGVLNPDNANNSASFADRGSNKSDFGTFGKKPNLRRNVIILISILIAFIAAIMFFFFVIKNRQSNLGDDVGQNTTSQVNSSQSVETIVYLDIDPIIVELTSSKTKKEYVRMSLKLWLEKQSDNPLLAAKIPIIKDTLITFLHTLRANDFSNSHSIIYLKEEIMKRINKIASPIVIKEVLFQEIVIN